MDRLYVTVLAGLVIALCGHEGYARGLGWAVVIAGTVTMASVELVKAVLCAVVGG